MDIGGTCDTKNSISPVNGVGSTPASGVIVGQSVDLLFANTYCNVFAAFGPSASGTARLQVQTSDTDVSGNFTDPTSGLTQMPTTFLSGGIFMINSGAGIASGGIQFAAFQRPHRYARLICMSGDLMNSPITAGFVSQLKTTTSGAGYSYQPLSGSVSV